MVRSWDIVTAGHLSANKFWGEEGMMPPRETLATCTLIRTDEGNILVDPALKAEELTKALLDRTGLHPEQIDLIYVTHRHEDHWMGTEAFPQARLLMAEDDCVFLQKTAHVFSEEQQTQIRRFEPMGEGEIAQGICTVALGGHTKGLRGLLMDAPEGKVLITGDAVMTREFYQAQEAFYYSVDPYQAACSVHDTVGMADVIVPGHGTPFLPKAWPAREMTPEPPVYETFDGPFGCATPLSVFDQYPAALEVYRKWFPYPQVSGDRFLTLNADLPLSVFLAPLARGRGEETARRLILKLNEAACQNP